MAPASKSRSKLKSPAGRSPRKKAAAPAAKRTPAVRRKKTAAAKPRATRAAKSAGLRRRVVRTAQPAPPPLPESYGTRRLYLVARDPRWLYAHWDFSREEQRALNRLSATGRLTLRIYEGAMTGPLAAQAELHTDSRHWFVPVGRGDTRYHAELGYVAKSGGWVGVVASRPAITPPEAIAPEAPVVFATIPAGAPVREIVQALGAPVREVIQALGAAVAQSVPPAQVIRQFEATAALPELQVFEPVQQWTPRQALELARIIGPQEILRRMESELAAPAVSRLLPARRPGSPAGGWGHDNLGGWGGGWSGNLS
jgi:hypothetical protein